MSSDEPVAAVDGQAGVELNETKVRPADAAAESFDPQTVNTVINNFDPGMFDLLAKSTASLVRATGLVDDADIANARSRFVAPECFAEGVTRLANDRIVVLCGAAGIGKHASALCLLGEVTDARLYRLSPQIPLVELAERDYEAGCGYLVIDRVVDPDSAESDFEWRVVRDRLNDRKAFLVVTRTADARATSELHGHMAWSCPVAERVLRAYWSGEWPEEHEETLSEALRSSDRVADIVELARRLDSGEPVDAAVTHFDAGIRAQVVDWFDAPPARRKVLEVTTLAFTLGVDERHFDAALVLLRQALQQHMPEPVADEAPTGEDHLPQLRGQLAENPLVAITTMPTELGSRGALLFAQSGVHDHVLGQLWRRMDVRFWDAVWTWLDLVVVRSRYEQRVPLGMVALAEVALEEVLPVLDSWARGVRGSAGQRAAVYTLWLMTYRDSLAPVALQIATRWITGHSPAHRWVAAMAFSGPLGVRYPHDAVSQLWQLCVQAHTVDGDVEMVFGELFSILVRETEDAGIVLTVLAGKVRRFARTGAKPRMAAVAVRTAVAALAAVDPLSGRHAVLSYLARFPDRTDVIGELLAGAVVHRPVRVRAIRTLRGLLEGLDKDGDGSLERARDLGRALAAHLPPDEWGPLEISTRAAVARPKKEIGTLLDALFDALRILAS